MTAYHPAQVLLTDHSNIHITCLNKILYRNVDHLAPELQVKTKEPDVFHRACV
jgi:hypothetical protein